MDVGNEALKAVPGVVGSLVSLHFLPGTSGVQKIVSFCGGAASAYYISPHVALYFGAKLENLSGFLVGVFAMAVIAKCFDVIALISPQKVLEKIMQKVGL